MRLAIKGVPELIHQAYDPSGAFEVWMKNVARLVGEVVGIPDGNFSLLRYTSAYQENRFGAVVSTSPRAEAMANAALRLDAVMPPAVVHAYFKPAPICVLQSELERAGIRSELAREGRRHAGVGDMLGIRLSPEPGLAAVLSFLVDHPVSLSRRERLVLSRIGLHVETAIRLRLRPEAVRMAFDPSCRILYDTVEEGRQIAATVRDVEAARADARARIAAWTALVRGEYSLVEREDRGKRLYLLLENAPETRARRSFTKREAAIVRRAARAFSGKMIAYSLGISEPAVSEGLSSAAAKLNLTSPVELARLARAMLDRAPTFDDATLSTSEREVLALLLEGKSNLEIARARGRSDRTIANQVAAILRKTGAESRRALRVRH